MALTVLLKKAGQRANHMLASWGIGDSKFPGKDGDMVFSKNNVCAHPPSSGETVHVPGYLTIYCQQVQETGITLTLQWLPNESLEKNPARINTMSPRALPNIQYVASQSRTKLRHVYADKKVSYGNQLLNSDTGRRDGGAARGLDAPAVTTQSSTETETQVKTGNRTTVVSAGNGRSSSTSDETEMSCDEEEHEQNAQGEGYISSSPYSSESGDESGGEDAAATEADKAYALLIQKYIQNNFLQLSPEEFAQQHNMMLPDGMQSDILVRNDDEAKDDEGREDKIRLPQLFSVDLGKMHTLRLFYSNHECTCGQLVIANHELQYKILHFHSGGLDKLAQIFEQWSALRAKSQRSPEAPLSKLSLQFSVVKPQLQKLEQHPEEELYDKVTWDYWRSCTSQDRIDDEIIRKAVFFGGMVRSLRKEAWPFLLNVYPWKSNREERDHIRNDLFIEYQNLRKRRLRNSLAQANAQTWQSIESSIEKDVQRTDRQHPFYESVENLETLHNILLNYAVLCPKIGYIQGMSDLLAPLLTIIQEESCAFWCFAGLMQRTVYINATRNRNNMERNLEYLRGLLRVMYVEFYEYLAAFGGDSLQLLFVHRWILLCFKREFPEEDVLRIWETCWTNYSTVYFHIFVALAIITVYGREPLRQRMTHDEILLYFSALSMHMNVDVVLKKARGLLYQFEHMKLVPCVLAELSNVRGANNFWDTEQLSKVQCVCKDANEDTCPYIRSLNSP